MISRPRQHLNKIIILTVIMLVLVSLYIFVFYLIRNEDKKTSLLEQNFSLMAKKEELMLSEQSIIRETEEKRKDIDKYFINQGNVVVFIEKLESLGAISGGKVSLSSVDIDKSRKNVLKANLSVSGGFSELFHFLSLLEAIPFEINIKHISLTSYMPTGPLAQDKKNKSEWDMNLSIDLVNFVSEK